jgi:hypothetical protein
LSSGTRLPIDGLITGQVRDARIFLTAVSALLELRNASKIRRVLVSVWEEDELNNLQLMDSLRQLGVRVITTSQNTTLRSVGNYWEQLRTLDRGLQEVEDGTLVLKTRADLVFLDGSRSIEKVLDATQGRWCHSLGLKHKIWIPSFVAFQPFFMADQCYLGLSDDLRKFVRYDAQLEAWDQQVAMFPGSKTHPSAASAEIRFWIQPFLDQFPVLFHYRHSWPHSLNGFPEHSLVHKTNLDSSLFNMWLAVYWHVMSCCFIVSEGNFLLGAGVDENSTILVRARSHSNNSENFIDDAINPVNNFPVSYSTDRGLKKFLSEQPASDFLCRYERALHEANSHQYDSHFIEQLGKYIEEIMCLVPSHLQAHALP